MHLPRLFGAVARLWPRLWPVHCVGLVLVWLVAFLFHEVLLPRRALARCAWPASASPGAYHMALVADPQLIDNHTYPGRPEPLLAISKHTADRYMRRNFRALVHQMYHRQPLLLRVRLVVFLGDYLDNGRLLLDQYYARERRRFDSVFRYDPRLLVPLASAQTEPPPSVVELITNVAGNHDLGWADGVKIPLRVRFAQSFGSPNTVFMRGGVLFVVLDTLLLLATDEAISKPARDFLERLAPKSASPNTPRVLLTHVPLWRLGDPGVCGLLRESPTFPIAKGYQYQTVIDELLTKEILERVLPDYVFSGDDHDYCATTHFHHHTSLPEITVKLFSMAMGIRRPALQLVTLSPATPRIQTSMCILPRPYLDVATYGFLAAVLVAVVLAARTRGTRWNKPLAGLPHHQLTAASLSRLAPADLRAALVDMLQLSGVVFVLYVCFCA